MITSTFHDAKKQGMLGFVLHALCGGERALVCVTHVTLMVFDDS